MLDVMSSDYIRTARQRRSPRHQVVLRHRLCAVIPLVTVMAPAHLVFLRSNHLKKRSTSIDGMGKLFFGSLLNGDATTLTAWLVVTALFIVAFSLVADLACTGGSIPGSDRHQRRRRAPGRSSPNKASQTKSSCCPAPAVAPELVPEHRSPRQQLFWRRFAAGSRARAPIRVCRPR